MASTSSDSSVTNSLDRALAMMEALLAAPHGLTHAELCRKLTLPSSTCTYITRKLLERGYLHREAESRRYRLGLKTVSLAHGALHGLGFRSVSEPVLYRLTAETGLSAGIGLAQGDHVLLVDRVDGPDVLQDVVSSPKPRGRRRDKRDVGRELPFHTTALGKTLLAFMPEEERDHLLHGIRLERWTRTTIVREFELRRQLASVRKQGFALSEEEHYPSVRALAVPILDISENEMAGIARAALSLNGPKSGPAWDDVAALLKAARYAAREIARTPR